MENIIFDFVKKNDLIGGICDADPLFDMKKILLNKDVPFINSKNNIESRINPKCSLQNAQSIIVIGQGYRRKESFKIDNELRGNISLLAFGTDYHITMKILLEELVQKLLHYEKFDYKICVDTGMLLERELAKKSGLGFVGRNCCIISDKFGSFFTIGYILTSLKLKTTSPQKISTSSGCSNCNLCIKSCPGKALTEKISDCNFKNCVSFLTQSKQKFTPSQIKSMQMQLYGCDVCQNVCPYNKSYIGEICDIDKKRPRLDLITSSSNSQLKSFFKDSSLLWKVSLLKRNAIIALGNSRKKIALDILQNLIPNENTTYLLQNAIQNLKENR